MARTRKSMHLHSGNQKRRAKLKPQDATLGLEVVHPMAAGIDVGNQDHWVAVPSHMDEQPVRPFGCFTSELKRMAEWLKGMGIKTVAMQSTGVYGIAVYEILEQHGMEVYLVNARDTKNLPGRKSDVQECQWLLKLHVYGLLRNSFHPAEEIRIMRTYWRQRAQHIADAARCVQRMQKALTQMNVQLANVISDISGTTGQAIIRAILRGERDAEALSKLADPRIKATRTTIAASLEGNWRKELLFVLQQENDLHREYQKRIEECDGALAKQLAKMESKADPLELPPVRRDKRAHGNIPVGVDLRKELYRVSGVDLTRIDGINVMTAQTVLAEVGTDMSKFRNEGAFVSWLGLAPNNRITGGKVIGQDGKKKGSRAGTALRQAASTLLRSTSYLGAQYRRFRTKQGAQKAIKTMARKLGCIVFGMLKHGTEYVDRGQQYYQERYRQQQISAVTKKAKELGLQVVPCA